LYYLLKIWRIKERRVLSKKYLLGTVLLLSIVLAGGFSSLKITTAQAGEFKVGMFVPMDPLLPHYYAGFLPATEMMARDINNSGGLVIGGQHYMIKLKYVHEPYDLPSGYENTVQTNIMELLGWGANIIIGGFRTECVEKAIQVLSSEGVSVPFFICGAATNELLTEHVHTSGKPYPYDHVYRITPINSTALLRSYSGTIKGYLCSGPLVSPTLPLGPLIKLFGKYWYAGQTIPQVKTALLLEALAWTAGMKYYLWDNKTLSYMMLGPYVNVTRCDEISVGETQENLNNLMSTYKSEGINLILHVFSAPVGVKVINAWANQSVPALPVGINVMSQAQDFWTWTEGRCEYESHLMTMGTRTPMTPGLVQFWDNFVAFTGGKWPLYTGLGVVNTLDILNQTLRQIPGLTLGNLAGKFHDTVCPTINSNWQFQALNGIFKFTEVHDIFCNSFGPTWEGALNGYVRAHTCQWLDGRLEDVCPINLPYSKIYCLPPWMYTLIWDITYDAYVGVDDVVGAAENFGAEPGTPRWDHRSDVTFDDYVGVDDIVEIAEHFGSEWPTAWP
jgi:hypothetical protein